MRSAVRRPVCEIRRGERPRSLAAPQRNAGTINCVPGHRKTRGSIVSEREGSRCGARRARSASPAPTHPPPHSLLPSPLSSLRSPLSPLRSPVRSPLSVSLPLLLHRSPARLLPHSLSLTPLPPGPLPGSSRRTATSAGATREVARRGPSSAASPEPARSGARDALACARIRVSAFSQLVRARPCEHRASPRLALLPGARGPLLPPARSAGPRRAPSAAAWLP